MSALSSTRAMADRLRRLGVDVDGPGYQLRRPFGDALTPAQQAELATKVRFGIGLGGRR